MSLLNTFYPTFVDTGIVNNVFPGYSPVLIKFKREDIEVISVGAGANNKLLITVVGDITSAISIPESVYLYSSDSSHTYDLSAELLDINFTGVNTELTIDADFINITAGGYLNYLQDWLCECQLIDPTNNDIKVFKPILADDGNNFGEVEIDVSIIVDQLTQEFKTIGGEVTEGRIEFNVEFRESWRDNRDENFTLINDYPIIIVFSEELIKPETFINQLTPPILWSGYINGISFLHSNQNYAGETINIIFDELDINKEILTSDGDSTRFNIGDFGFLFVSTEDAPSFQFNQYTKYLRLKAITQGAADFASPDFDTPDFVTTL